MWGSRRWHIRETILGSAEAEGKYIKQTGGRGQYGHVKIRIKKMEPIDPEKKMPKNVTREDHFEFINNIKGGVVPQEFIAPVEKGAPRGDGERISRRIPDGGHLGRPLRWFVSRRRLL